MTNVGVSNPNWRGAEMREYLNGIRSDGKKLVELGSCGHELKGRPLWMVGKSQLCFSCWEKEVEEQKRILENITAEAQDEYFAPEPVAMDELTAATYGQAQDPAWYREMAARSADYFDLKATEDNARF